MIERTIEIPTKDGATTTFIVHPERGGPHPAILFFMDAPAIREELRRYGEHLAEKPELVAANKLDLLPDETAVEALKDQIGRDVLAISAATGRNLSALCERLWQYVAAGREVVEPSHIEAEAMSASGSPT